MPRIIMRGLNATGHEMMRGLRMVMDVVAGGATAGNEIVISAVATDFLAYNAGGDALAWS